MRQAGLAAQIARGKAFMAMSHAHSLRRHDPDQVRRVGGHAASQPRVRLPVRRFVSKASAPKVEATFGADAHFLDRRIVRKTGTTFPHNALDSSGAATSHP